MSASVLTNQIITEATEKVDTYIATAISLQGELDALLKNLTATNFQGDASAGYMEFYVSKVLPALKDNLTDPNSLTAGVKNILANIQAQLLNTVDPQLGDFNRNPG